MKSKEVLVHFGKIKLEIASWFVKFDSKFEAKFVLSSCASILVSGLLHKLLCGGELLADFLTFIFLPDYCLQNLVLFCDLVVLVYTIININFYRFLIYSGFA